MTQRGNLFQRLPPAEAEEKFETLSDLPGARVERIVSRGQTSPPGFWYDQAWDEWVVLLQGKAALKLAEPDETIDLAAGDWVMIPAHRRHRVERTSVEPAAVWLAVHSPPPG